MTSIQIGLPAVAFSSRQERLPMNGGQKGEACCSILPAIPSDKEKHP